MTHLDTYGKIMEQGSNGELNKYLLFLNQKIEDQALKIITNEIETNHQ